MGLVQNELELGLDVPGLSEEDRARLRVKYERWDKLIEKGVIVEIHITGWTATTSIDEGILEMLGIPLKNDSERRAYKTAVRMGQLALIPPDLRKEQARLDQAARGSVNNASSALIVGNFVPEPNILPLMDDLSDKRKEYLQFAQEQIVDKLEEHVSTMREHHRVIFGSAYDRLVAQGAYMEISRDEFVSNASDYLYRKMPTKEEILDKYTFEYDIHIVPFRDKMAERELNYQRIMEQAAQSEERVTEITQETQKRIESEMQAQARPRALALLRSIDEAEASMLATISDASKTILDALEKNGSLPGTNASQLQTMLEKIKMFKQSGMLIEDSNMDQATSQLEEIVAAYKEYNSKERKEQAPELAQTLRSIKVASNRMIEDMPQVRVTRADMDMNMYIEPGETSTREVRQEAEIDMSIPEEIRNMTRTIREDDS